jgi:hypothetical protein
MNQISIEIESFDEKVRKVEDVLSKENEGFVLKERK